MHKLFDTNLWLAHKYRALTRKAAGGDFLMQRVASDLNERLSSVGRSFNKAATLFCQTPAAAETIAQTGKAGQILQVECDAAFFTNEKTLLTPFETLPFEPQSLDLVVSLLSMQAMNDIPGLLAQTRRALRPDGLFLAAMAGAGTLAELRESLMAAETELYGGISPRVSPFVDVRDAGALLQRAGFALPVADVETMSVRYDHLFALMADLRAMGETNILASRSRKPVSRAFFSRAAEIYAERFSDPDGRIRASFQIVWLSGWAPDPSQQKPLRPGSAKMSLAEALKHSGNQ